MKLRLQGCGHKECGVRETTLPRAGTMEYSRGSEHCKILRKLAGGTRYCEANSKQPPQTAGQLFTWPYNRNVTNSGVSATLVNNQTLNATDPWNQGPLKTPPIADILISFPQSVKCIK